MDSSQKHINLSLSSEDITGLINQIIISKKLQTHSTLKNCVEETVPLLINLLSHITYKHSYLSRSDSSNTKQHHNDTSSGKTRTYETLLCDYEKLKRGYYDVRDKCDKLRDERDKLKTTLSNVIKDNETKMNDLKTQNNENITQLKLTNLELEEALKQELAEKLVNDNEVSELYLSIKKMEEELQQVREMNDTLQKVNEETIIECDKQKSLFFEKLDDLYDTVHENTRGLKRKREENENTPNKRVCRRSDDDMVD